ncbi:3D domain-containing protein [Clostridium formicaceticum]|uniref:Cell wall-binding protein YocH n=1 Tax=Clostridium formicaceticum TaxID=1497 RepID=A0AAC9RK98_9CLOT|nr:3D domain-containing protein [Clostridium formicaceticum]AOY75488.1 hypothetical protein BJL90_06000 [Clostridium formicaceticum]ARE85775.1 Cell wall-binding protein YocH precursor [Clostridium formicaceticum]
METFLGGKDFLKGVNKKAFIAIVFVTALCVSLGLMAMRKNVTIVYDGKEERVVTFASTVEALINKQGIEVQEVDKVVPGLQEKLKEDTRIIIHRAFEIQLIEGQQQKSITTAEKTVGDLIETLDLKLGEKDKVQPDLHTTLNPGDIVEVIRVTEEVLTENQEIPFQTTIKYNEELELGKTRRIQEGESGLKEIKLGITYENNVEVAREVIEEKIIKEATNEIVEKGTGNILVTSRGDTRRYREVLIMEASAYTAGYESTGKSPGDPYFGITGTGTQVRPGVVAVDPKVIPLGSSLYVESLDRTPSYGMASAEDTGGAIKGNKIDLYFENRSDALRFGRRKVKVYILD